MKRRTLIVVAVIVLIIVAVVVGSVEGSKHNKRKARHTGVATTPSATVTPSTLSPAPVATTPGAYDAMPDISFQILVSAVSDFNTATAVNVASLDSSTRDALIVRMTTDYNTVTAGLQQTMSVAQRAQLPTSTSTMKTVLNQYRGYSDDTIPLMTDAEATSFMTAFVAWRAATDPAVIKSNAAVMAPFLSKQRTVWQTNNFMAATGATAIPFNVLDAATTAAILKNATS